MEILIVILFFWVLSLQVRSNRLDQKIRSMEPDQEQDLLNDQSLFTSRNVEFMLPSETQEIPQATPPDEADLEPVVHETVPHVLSEADTEQQESVEDLLITKVLPSVGVLSVVLGVGFLVTWSYSNGLLGPKGLLSLGVLLSLALMGAAEYLRASFSRQFVYLTAAGLLGNSVCVLSAYAYYGFISMTFAMVSLVMLIVASFLLAVRYNSRLLSGLSVLGGFLLPLLLGIADSQDQLIAWYVAALVVAGAVAVYRTQWPETIIGMYVTFVYYAFLLVPSATISAGEQVLSAPVYLLWVYGIVSLCGLVIVWSARQLHQAGHTDYSSLEMSSEYALNILLWMSALGATNVFAYLVFDTMAWSYFGFFVLLQGFVLYGISRLMDFYGLVWHQQVCLIGVIASIAFATVWEINIELYPLALLMVLSLEAVAYAYAATQTTSLQLQKFLYIFAVLSQVVALYALSFIDTFLHQTMGVGTIVLVAGALIYWYRQLQESDFLEAWLPGLQFIIAIGLAGWWHYDVLAQAISFPASHFWPYISMATIAVAVWYYGRINNWLMVLWLGHAILLVNSLVFILQSLQYHNQVPALLVCSWMVLLMVHVFVGVESTRTTLHKPLDEHRDLALFASLIVVIWGMFWIFREPVTTINIMVIGAFCFAWASSIDYRLMRLSALWIMGAVVGKLYIIDVWQWSIFWKFVAFVPVGLVLISLPFWYQALSASNKQS